MGLPSSLTCSGEGLADCRILLVASSAGLDSLIGSPSSLTCRGEGLIDCRILLVASSAGLDSLMGSPLLLPVEEKV